MIETAANEPSEAERNRHAQLLNSLYHIAWNDPEESERFYAARAFLRESGCQDPCARKWLGLKGGRDK